MPIIPRSKKGKAAIGLGAAIVAALIAFGVDIPPWLMVIFGMAP